MVLAHSQGIFPDPPEFGTRSWLASLCDSLDGGAINRSTELGYDIHSLPWYRWPIEIPSGKHTKKLWKITVFNGKTHYKWAMFNSYVKLPEGRWFTELKNGEAYEKNIYWNI